MPISNIKKYGNIINYLIDNFNKSGCSEKDWGKIKSITLNIKNVYVSFGVNVCGKSDLKVIEDGGRVYIGYDLGKIRLGDIIKYDFSPLSTLLVNSNYSEKWFNDLNLENDPDMLRYGIRTYHDAIGLTQETFGSILSKSSFAKDVENIAKKVMSTSKLDAKLLSTEFPKLKDRQLLPVVWLDFDKYKICYFLTSAPGSYRSDVGTIFLTANVFYRINSISRCHIPLSLLLFELSVEGSIRNSVKGIDGGYYVTARLV